MCVSVVLYKETETGKEKRESEMTAIPIHSSDNHAHIYEKVGMKSVLKGGVKTMKRAKDVFFSVPLLSTLIFKLNRFLFHVCACACMMLSSNNRSGWVVKR